MLVRISSIVLACLITPAICLFIDFRPPIMLDERSYFVLSITLLLIWGVPLSTMLDTFLKRRRQWTELVLGRMLLYPFVSNVMLISYYSYHGFLLVNWTKAPFNYLMIVVALHSFIFALVLQMLERFLQILRTIRHLIEKSLK